MRAIGNFLWFILGGFLMGLTWWVVGLVAFITIVGIPWGKACFVIGQFTFFPFGKEAVSRKELHQKDDIGTGGLVLVLIFQMMDRMSFLQVLLTKNFAEF